MPARGKSILQLMFAMFFLAVPAFSQRASSQIKKKPTQELIDCLKQDAKCGFEWYEARDELARRKTVALLIRTFRASRDDLQQERIIEALFEINDSRIPPFMREVATDRLEQQDWFALQYLAERGDRRALTTLSRNCGQYGISSLQWAVTLKVFGERRYRPAIPCLVTWVSAASLNAADAAYVSLRILFPGSPELKSLEEAQAYFEKRAKEEEASKKKPLRR